MFHKIKRQRNEDMRRNKSHPECLCYVSGVLERKERKVDGRKL